LVLTLQAHGVGLFFSSPALGLVVIKCSVCGNGCQLAARIDRLSDKRGFALATYRWGFGEHEWPLKGRKKANWAVGVCWLTTLQSHKAGFF
jgi:hypothetical protein